MIFRYGLRISVTSRCVIDNFLWFLLILSSALSQLFELPALLSDLELRTASATADCNQISRW